MQGVVSKQGRPRKRLEKEEKAARARRCPSRKMGVWPSVLRWGGEFVVGWLAEKIKP